MAVGAGGPRQSGKRGASPGDAPAPGSVRSQAKAPTREALLAALAERDRELAEAREQQAAVAEVLAVINASPGDLAPVFAAIAEKAVRLCEASEGLFWLVEGETARLPDHQGCGWAENLPRSAPVRDLLGREAHLPPFLHIDDLKATKAYQKRASPLITTAVDLGGVRTNLTAPMLDEGAVVGVFTLARREVRPFTDNQIALVQAFAAQALIAMKNARLFNETEEALERQTATAEILRVIASSPSDAQPVFEAIAESAKRLVGAKTALVFRVIDGMIHLAAHTALPTPEEEAALLALYPRPYAESVYARVEKAGEPLVYPDVDSMPPYLRGFITRFGHASFTAAPMTSLGRGLGVVSVLRTERGSLPAHQIQLLQTFADQAVIAIENARLFNETKEALERQTATAEILKVIASSPSDAQPVFDAIAESAKRLLGGHSAAVTRVVGEWLHLAAMTAVDPVGDAAMKAMYPLPRASSAGLEEAMARERFLEAADTESDLDGAFRDFARARGFRSVVMVPLLASDDLIGMIAVTRKETGRFAPHHVQLLQTFADQAVIAIENARLFNETREALERQTATSEILKVIAASPSDAAPVFEAIAHSARRLLGGFSSVVWRYEGDIAHLAAFTPTNPEADAELQARSPLRVNEFGPLAAPLSQGESVQIPDTEHTPEQLRDLARLRGYRAMLFTPLMQQGAAIGFVGITRKEPGPFDPDEVALLKTFADQAVIAIENARLFNETQEALDQQKASAEVLGAISKSVSDTAPVFEAILDACQRLFGAEAIGIYTIGNDDMVRVAAWRGPWADEVRRDVTPVGESVTGRIIRERRTHHIPDHAAEPNLSPTLRERVNRLGNASLFYAPMLWEDVGLGSILVVRKPPRPFSEREQALLQSFADQAVIAIENARLFAEVQARTRDLQESLAQQTATADVLKVISRSAFDLDAVLETLVNSMRHLCSAPQGMILMRDSDHLRMALQRGYPIEFESYVVANPPPIAPNTGAGRAAQTRSIVHLPDVLADPDYRFSEGQRLGQYRAMLSVPMLRENRLVGVFSLGRPTPGPFTDRQIELVQTFADQAVIAIENVRLFEEVQARTRDLEESLARLTATADVLKVISRSAFDLDAAASTILEAAARLCRAPLATIHLRDRDVCRLATQFGLPEAFEREMRESPIPVRYPLHSRRTAQAGEIAHFADAWTDPEYLYKSSARLGGYRAIVVIPLMRESELVGIFSLGRPEPEPFTESQIKLTQTFADQAAIAIENARLFNEVKARTDELSESLALQTATSEILRVISQSPTNAGPVFDRIVTTAARLLLCDYAYVILTDGKEWRPVTGATPGGERAETLPDKYPVDPAADFPSRAIASKAMVHLPDWSLIDLPAIESHVRDILGAQSSLYLPFLREGECVGLLGFVSRRAHAFGPAEIAQAESFRDQALIAIENTRLFNETQEALQQQTATADVLKVISRSAFDLQVVLNTLIRSAVELIGATHGTVCLRDGEVFRYRAHWGLPAEFERWLADHPARADRRSSAGRVILSGDVVRIPDVAADPDFEVPANRFSQTRSILGAPLLIDGAVEGVLIIGRREAGDFTARQVELVQTFADQAVIAIQNSRLFGEVQAKTLDLEESLAQQTATADVLKVISRSAFDLGAIFQTLVATAVDLCKAFSGTLCVRDGEVFRYQGMAGPGASQELQSYLEAHPIVAPDRETIAGRTILAKAVEHIPDVAADASYAVPLAAYGNPARALLGVPLLGKDRVEGALVLTRAEPGEFPARQIEILKTFADQAVIAIENARLFGQVQARTQELQLSLDDLRRAQDRLIQSEKLASLGQLTAGIAHEIKNPLNFINNFSNLSRELMDELGALLEKAPLDAPDREEAHDLIGMIDANLDKVVSHGKRADSIVKNMLLHSREGSGERGGVNVNAMVEEALNLAYHGARAEKRGFNVTIEKALDPSAGEADVYLQEMTRVLLNLISNGFYATTKRKQAEPDAGYEPTISASTRDFGHSVEIVIRDNGTGIPDDVKAKMFNPFFTTKPAGEGTGLGLSLSHDIVVKQHGGTIEVATEPGAFTAFTITLPRKGAGA